MLVSFASVEGSLLRPANKSVPIAKLGCLPILLVPWSVKIAKEERLPMSLDQHRVQAVVLEVSHPRDQVCAPSASLVLLRKRQKLRAASLARWDTNLFSRESPLVHLVRVEDMV